MKEYLRLPTHKKLGWLFFILGFVITGFVAWLFKGTLDSIFGIVQWGFAIAFIVEIIAIIIGKNKPLLKP